MKKPITLSVCVFMILNLTGCATMLATSVKARKLKIADQISCQKNQSASSPVTFELCQQVNERIQQENDLKNARVGFDLQGKGKLQLVGHYKNEDEVVRVFAIAQAMVGSDWVSPVKPGHIDVEAWQECLKNRIAGRVCTGWDIEPYSLDKMPPGPVRNRYALVVGVGEFKNGIRPLRFAANDAKAVADYLAAPKFGNFPKANITLLTDEQATSQAIQASLTDIESKVQKDDMVVVYISSHGAPPNIYGHVNIVTYDTEVLFGDRKAADLESREKILQRQALWDSSIPRKRLHEFFVNLASKDVKRAMMVLDVCYSGDALKAFPGFKPSGNDELARLEESYSTGYSAEQLMNILGAKDLVLDTTATADGTFSTLQPDTVYTPGRKNTRNSKRLRAGNEWGQVIISASSEGEQSWEPNPAVDPGTTNSYFTHYFLEQLKQSGGRVQDSFSASVPRVLEKIMQIAHKSQRPQSFALPDQQKWNFRLTGR
jgi:hypothetical protein